MDRIEKQMEELAALSGYIFIAAKFVDIIEDDTATSGGAGIREGKSKGSEEKNKDRRRHGLWNASMRTALLNDGKAEK